MTSVPATPSRVTASWRSQWTRVRIPMCFTQRPSSRYAATGASPWPATAR
ncbi:hypothetical protein [Lysobacter gummosus]